MADCSPYSLKTLLQYLADLEGREQTARELPGGGGDHRDDPGLRMAANVVISCRKLRAWPDVQRFIRDCEAARYTFDAAGANRWVAQVCKAHGKLPDQVADWSLNTFCELADADPRNLGAKPKPRGRKKADYETVQREAQLAADWEQARDTGIYKADFEKQKGLKVKDLDALLDRVAWRQRASE